MPPFPFLVVLFASLGAFAPASIALTLPAMSVLQHELGVGPGFGEHGLAAFFAMLSVGMLVYGPLSDRWGRRPVLLAGLALYVAACLGCVVANHADLFVAARAAQALDGGGAIVLPRPVPAPPDGAAAVVHGAGGRAVPLLSPLLGQWLLTLSGWRLIFAVQASFGALCLLRSGWSCRKACRPSGAGPCGPARSWPLTQQSCATAMRRGTCSPAAPSMPG